MPTDMVALALLSGMLAGVLAEIAGRFAEWFRIPFVDVFLAPGLVANIVFLLTLGRLPRGDMRSAVRLVAAWLVICPISAGLTAYVRSVIDFWGAADYWGVPVSPWSPSFKMIGLGACRGGLGVVASAWLLVRTSIKSPAGRG